MTCEHVSLELKTSEAVSSAYTNEGWLFHTVVAQHENRRQTVFVDEDCVDIRSDADDLRTRDCLYGESILKALQQRMAILIVNSAAHR